MDAPPQDRAPIETPDANRLAAGAPGTVTLGGTLYVVRQPTNADFVALRKYLGKLWKEQHTAPLAAVAAELAAMPKELQALVAGPAVARAVDRTDGTGKAPESGDLSELLLEPDGAAFWVWWLARDNHPGLQLGEVRAKVTEDTIHDAFAELLAATDMKTADPN